MRPLESILQKHDINYHFYADDTQLHLSFDPKDSITAVNRLNRCLADIRSWMSDNFLKLNADKTELLLIGNPKRVSKVQSFQLAVGDAVVRPSASARNLGVIFDDTLSFKQFCLKSASAATFHIRSLSRIRSHLSHDLTRRLCTSFVLSRLDYCNSLLAGLPKCSLRPLQLAQNMAARLVFKARKSCHITPLLKQLEWLPVDKRIEEKVLKIVYKSQNGLCPSYFSDLLNRKVHSRSLRSTDGHSLVVPFFKLRTVGDRSFGSVGPRLWNDLPLCYRDGSLIRTDADAGTSFSALLRSYLEAACYSGRSTVSSFLNAVPLVVRKVGCPKRTESPSGSVFAIEKFSSVMIRA